MTLFQIKNDFIEIIYQLEKILNSMKTIEPFYQINLDFTGFRVGFRIYSHRGSVTELYTHLYCL